MEVADHQHLYFYQSNLQPINLFDHQFHQLYSQNEDSLSLQSEFVLERQRKIVQIQS